MHYTLYPINTCSTRIDVDVENGLIHNLKYTDGCNGNLKAVGRLCEGRPAKEVISTLRGVRCGSGETSCTDQLSRLLEEALRARGEL